MNPFWTSFICGAGLAFGSVVGLTLAVWAIQPRRAAKEAREHMARVEARLGAQADSVAKIANLLESRIKDMRGGK